MTEILEKIKEKSEDPSLIEKAFNFAKDAHTGQKRFSGEDYIIHPLKVAQTLTEMQLDSKTVAAALLHDVADDTPKSLSEIEKEFGKEVSFLVGGVSKLGKIRYPKAFSFHSSLPQAVSPRVENLRKMFFAMAEDLRVILIKLADRLHNMETMKYMPRNKQKRFALETMEIFSPIADRLGMGEMKVRLENLAFPYLYPKEYDWLIGKVKEKYEERERYLKRVEPVMKKMLKKEGIIPLSIHSRAKSHWSLYKKLLRHNMNFEEIYDLVALRIIVKSLDSCYKTLGVLHKRFKPLVGRIQDFIALPKPNGYQSLHTTFFCLDGKLVEAQIRTPEMHEAAEHGICAHWAYKEKVNLAAKKNKFTWIQQLKDWQKEISGTKEFLDGLKFDFFKNRIFVFTPKGDIIDLPEGASPVDFAYQIHSEVGAHCSTAKINGKIAPLDSVLKNGDIVEILVDKNRLPSHDWLKYTKTNLARSHIKKGAKGGFLEIIKEKIAARKIGQRIFRKKEEILRRGRKTASIVLIGGEQGISFSLAKCCNPKPSDQIEAFITKSNKAAVHKISCRNFEKAKLQEPEKVIGASWINI